MNPGPVLSKQDIYLAEKLRESRLLAVLLTPIGLFIGLWFCFSAVNGLILNGQETIQYLKTLAEGENLVIPIDAYQIEEMNEGKLVHVSDNAIVDEIIQDSLFEISVINVIKLRRTVEIYQWQEQQVKQSNDTINYTYEPVWSEHLIDSSQFAVSQKYRNPSVIPFTSETTQVKRVKLGNFNLSANFVAKMNKSQAFPMKEYSFLQVQGHLRTLFAGKKLHLNAGNYYIGQNPNYPQIGDVQIKFEVVRPETISIIAKQVNSYLLPYQTQTGSELELFEFGQVNANEMFFHEKINLFFKQLYKILLIFLIMFFGCYIMFGAWWLSKNMLPMGTPSDFVGWLLSLLMAILLILITKGFIWRDYNLMISHTLFATAIIFLYFFKFTRRQPKLKLIHEDIIPMKIN